MEVFKPLRAMKLLFPPFHWVAGSSKEKYKLDYITTIVGGSNSQSWLHIMITGRTLKHWGPCFTRAPVSYVLILHRQLWSANWTTGLYTSSLSILRGLVPPPPWKPKSTQVPYVEWHSICIYSMHILPYTKIISRLLIITNTMQMLCQ